MTLDTWVGLIVLAVLFLLEGLRPFDTGRRRRLRHGARNLSLALVSGLVGAAMAPLLVLSMTVADGHGWGLRHWFGREGWLGSVTVFVLFDLWMYLWHRANHQVAGLWRLHRVHHTDTAMDTTTALRFHPGEILLSSLANGAVLAMLGMTLHTFLVYKAVMVAVILFHHSNVSVPRRLDQVFGVLLVPPSMHRVHHSEQRNETDSNYGTIFSVWDRVFRSFRRRADQHAIRFGIGQFGDDSWQRPLRLLLLPLVSDHPIQTEAQR